MINLRNYPQLRLICWNRDPEMELDDAEAFALYERNWRLVDASSLSEEERQLIERLTRDCGNGVMNV